jgi:hypothetical protein
MFLKIGDLNKLIYDPGSDCEVGLGCTRLTIA